MQEGKGICMVYDCIPFFNELDILNLRLHVLDPYVDKFIIEEATVTFSGEPKELCFEKNKEMFREFLPKIEYIVVDNSPVNTTTHLRDKFQKNALEKGLADAGENDMILLSDVDEIPNPRVLQELKQNFDPDKVYHLAQRMFYCFINMEEVSGNLLSITGEFPGVERRMWLGTKIFAKRSIPKDGIIQLREAKVTAPNAVRVADGGWHFGYMGSRHEADVSKRIGDKVVAAAHQEYNKQDILAEAKYRLMLGEDMFGRDARFERVEVDDTYPEYLLQHRKDYEYLIMPPISKAKRNYIRISMKVKRFLRKVCRRIRRIFNR
jgi:glycosyl transferase GT17 family